MRRIHIWSGYVHTWFVHVYVWLSTRTIHEFVLFKRSIISDVRMIAYTRTYNVYVYVMATVWTVTVCCHSIPRKATGSARRHRWTRRADSLAFSEQERTVNTARCPRLRLFRYATETYDIPKRFESGIKHMYPALSAYLYVYIQTCI